MTPSTGRVVLYDLTIEDVQKINSRPNRVGNDVLITDTYPMIITRVWNNSLVNGQVLLDGDDVLWKTSVPQNEGTGRAAGKWRQPPTVA